MLYRIVYADGIVGPPLDWAGVLGIVRVLRDDGPCRPVRVVRA